MDGLVFIILVYSMVRLYFQDVIPHTAWVQLIFFGGLFFTGRILFRQLNRAAIPWLLTWLLWGGIAQALYGLGQLYEIWPSHHAAFPVTGSFFNPGPYSGWLACLIPIAIWVLVQLRGDHRINRISKFSAWAYLFLGGGVLIAAFSRAAWLASAAGSLIVLFPFIRSWLSSLGKRASWLLPVTGVVLIGLLSALYFFKKDSADGRLLVWSASMDMISDYPLFGVGWDRFRVMYPRYQAYYFVNDRGSERQEYLAGYTEYPFNEVLGWVSEMGLVGLILILVVWVLLARRLISNPRKTSDGSLRLLIVSVACSWLIFALFSYPMKVPVNATVGILIFSALVTFTSKYFISRKGPVTRLSNVIIVLFLLFVSGYSYLWMRKHSSIQEDWRIANSYFQSGHYEVANSKYIALYPLLNTEGQFLQFAGKSMSMARDFYRSRHYLEKALNFSSDPVIYTTLGQDYTLFHKVELDKIARAEYLLQMARYMEPTRYYPRYLLMDLYSRTNQEEKAIVEAKGILVMDTKVESEAVDQIKALAREKLNNTNTFRIKSTRKFNE